MLKSLSESVQLSSDVVIGEAIGTVAITILDNKSFILNSLYKNNIAACISFIIHHNIFTVMIVLKIIQMWFVFWCSILHYLLWDIEWFLVQQCFLTIH